MRLAILFVIGALLAGAIVGSFGLDVITQLTDALSLSVQSDPQSSLLGGAQDGAHVRLAQHGFPLAVVTHAVSVDPVQSRNATQKDCGCA